jgi:hypothetical protein
MPVSADGILEAVFDPVWAAVRLIVDEGMWPSAVDTITMFRSVSGEAEVAVRGLESRSVVGGTYVGSDHEMSLETTVSYRVIGYLAGVLVDEASVSVSTTGSEPGLWIKVAGKPDLTIRCSVRVLSEASSPTIGGTYQIAGGGGAVSQSVSEWSGIGAERLQVGLSLPVADVARFRATMSTRELLLQPVGTTDIDAGWYFVWDVGRSNPAQVESFTKRWFRLEVERTGVPAGAGSGIAGNSWAVLMEENATWADVLVSYASWFDVLKGGGS